MSKINLTDWIDKQVPSIVKALEDSNEKNDRVSTKEALNLVSREVVYQVLDDLLSVLFSGRRTFQLVAKKSMKLFVAECLHRVANLLAQQIDLAFSYRPILNQCSNCDFSEQVDDAIIFLLESLPDVHVILMEDIKAAFAGDPAANSIEEIILSYPCIEAIATQRIANLLYQKQVPVIPRIMTERAHSRTGIDIHPGATIGPAFFIDHGTGVVIGETTVIGRNVKIYQGVTLGALSFPKNADGTLIKKGAKRHPTIKDDVIIYASATVLGNITIGSSAVIGGNVFVTSDVTPGSKIYRN